MHRAPLRPGAALLAAVAAALAGCAAGVSPDSGRALLSMTAAERAAVEAGHRAEREDREAHRRLVELAEAGSGRRHGLEYGWRYGRDPPPPPPAFHDPYGRLPPTRTPQHLRDWYGVPPPPRFYAPPPPALYHGYGCCGWR